MKKVYNPLLMICVMCFVAIQMFAGVTSDTIPYEIRQSHDTLITFDYDTYTETFEVTKRDEYYVYSADTLLTTNDHDMTILTVVRNYMPLEDYIRNMRLGLASEEEIIEKSDTVIIADYENFTGKEDLIPVTNECYYLYWKSKALSHRHRLSIDSLNNFLHSDFRVASFDENKCEDIESFSMSVIITTAGKSPIMFNLNNKRNKLDVSRIPDYYFEAGSHIQLHDIRVNGKGVPDIGINVF